ncbi:alpha/beta hydrolase [Agrobacterium rubi]|nr:alpha/beta hydrolase [Agrobacterium rubi]NTF25153.1 alpha/beta hydrolase [Agrobacterium rubi]
MHKAFRLAIIMAMAYAAICVAMVVFQRSLIYMPAPDAYAPDAFGLAGVDVDRLKTPDGEIIETWRWLGSPDKPVIVFFHGNAGNLNNRHYMFQMFKNLGYGFVAVDYRGYGNSTGSPSYRTIIDDALLVFDRTSANQAFRGRKIVLYGESLGTGVATEVATRRRVSGIILQSAYTSIADAAKDRFPWLPIDLLLTERLSNIAHVEKISSPILILHGEQDEFFPVDMAQKLFNAALGKRRIEILEGVGHNDMHPERINGPISSFVELL